MQFLGSLLINKIDVDRQFLWLRSQTHEASLCPDFSFPPCQLDPTHITMQSFLMQLNGHPKSIATASMQVNIFGHKPHSPNLQRSTLCMQNRTNSSLFCCMTVKPMQFVPRLCKYMNFHQDWRDFLDCSLSSIPLAP